MRNLRRVARAVTEAVVLIAFFGGLAVILALLTEATR